jgi:NitT/TauT family transport system substrate-binding protein
MRVAFCRLTTVTAVMIAALGATAAPMPISADLKPIVVGALKGPSGIGMVRLFESPPSPADGSTVQLVGVASADLMTAKLISGEYDAGVLPINIAAKLYSAGIPLRLAAIVGDGMASFLSADTSVVSIFDLKGKLINVAGQGATPDFLFRRLLKGVGLDPEKDLRLDYSLPYPEAAAALAAGKIAYAILPEPFSTMAKVANPALFSPFDLGALWTEQTGQANYPMTAFVVSSKLAIERPQAVKAILEAYAASIDWVIAKPFAAGALVEKHELGLKAGIASKAIPASAYVFTLATTARSTVEALLNVFLELAPASVGGKLPDGGFYASFK